MERTVCDESFNDNPLVRYLKCGEVSALYWMDSKQLLLTTDPLDEYEGERIDDLYKLIQYVTDLVSSNSHV